MNELKWINMEKYAKYLTESRHNNMVKKIIENTHYYTTNELIEMLKRSLIKFIDIYPKYNLYIPPFDKKYGKIGSEHFLMLQLESLLHPIEVLTCNKITTNDYPIILIDDAIYSSINMCGTIDNYTYDLNTIIKNDFYCIVGVVSNPNPEVVTRSFAKKIIYDICLEHLTPSKLFSNELLDQDFMYIEFGCESSNVIPCFFEHKIANEFGTYTDLYRSITSIKISRKCIDQILESDIIDFRERLRSSINIQM